MLQLWVFQRAESALAEVARENFSFFKNSPSHELIPNWTRNSMIYLHIRHCNINYSKDKNNSVPIKITGCKNLSAFKIVAGHETLFCWLSLELQAIRYNSSLINLKLVILFSPLLFEDCWVQYWYIVHFVFNIAVIPNIKYILHYNVSLSTFTTIKRLSSRLENIFVNISQICFESVLSSVKPLLDKCVCVWSILVLKICGP